MQSELGDPRRRIAPEAVLLGNGDAIHDIVALGQLGEQLRHLIGWMLEVVVHGDDDRVASSTNSRQQCVVLAVVAHQVDAIYRRLALHQGADDLPTLVTTPVVD
jgi:hypothetical protein